MDKLLYLIKKLIPRKLFKLLQPVYHFLLSYAAALVYCFPSNSLIVVGVTGTTGKTTSVYLIAKMLEESGLKTGFTSTAMFNDGRREWLNEKKMTMIGRLFTQRILRKMVKNKCQVAIVETTSEGIVQFRHRFINYDILVFTGLYEEHIESHGSFDNYKKAKGRLFAHLKKCNHKYRNDNYQIVNTGESGLKKIDHLRVKKTIIANGDDEHKDYFLSFWAEEKYVYSQSGNQHDDSSTHNVAYGNLKITGEGTEFIFQNTKVALQLIGAFSAGNAMNGVCVGLALGLREGKIKKGLEKISGVAGRLEKIDEGQSFTVIIDYAFEPNALSKLYNTVDLIPHKKIIHVLGSTGGGRDIARRPKLGKIAGEKADLVIITNEDPYDDDPEIIIDQVSLGAEKAGKTVNKNLFKITDRRQAIKKALSLASDQDIVLITGKGSEQAICVANGQKITWDDRAVARSLLQNKYRQMD
ncbi:UDP-N-acetylmuramyl-tripeptide synthetase [Candidatus Parcubacteria bacterium]|nr:UDP-N-acetylmuramyl-tripeptide synthetase [Candidatus Parcubacteria bacterium]